MRILSQKGLHSIDINYDLVCVSVNFTEPCDIIAYPIMADRDDSYWTMAKYSTPEKAEKAVEILHNKYYEYKFEGTYRQSAEWYYPIFQFPADEEITVGESEGRKSNND